MRMNICLQFPRKFYHETWHETGKDIRFNIKQARKQAELLAQHRSEQKIECRYEPHKTPTQNWDQAKSIPQQALGQTYPVAKNNRTTLTWEHKGYEHATPNEKQRHEQLTQERQRLQKTINRIDTQNNRMQKHHIQRTTIRAWGVMRDFLRKNKARMRWAATPAVDLAAKTRQGNKRKTS